MAGARYGSWETRSWAYGYDANGNRNRTTRTGYRPDDMLTPYAGLVFDFNSIFSGYVSYTDIFKPQNYRDRNGNYLEPVVGNMYEAGVKAEFFGALLNASAAVFEGKQDNVAEIDDSVPVNSPPDGSQAYRPPARATRSRAGRSKPRAASASSGTSRPVSPTPSSATRTACCSGPPPRRIPSGSTPAGALAVSTAASGWVVA